MLNNFSVGLVRISLSLVCVWLSVNTNVAQSQDKSAQKKSVPQKQETESTHNARDWVAIVNDQLITKRQVDYLFSQAVGERKLSESQISKTMSVILEKLINQQVVIGFLAKFEIEAGENEIVERIDELEANLATVNKKLEDHLAEIKLSKSDLEFLFKWDIAWNKYIQQKVTDQQLEAYFNRNKRKYDGTRIRVAHIFLKNQTAAPSDSRVNSEKKRYNFLMSAKKIHREIDSGETSWDAALKKHSQSPSKDDGGEVGWIQFDGPMPKSFTRAAFELNTGQMSEPIQTPFGIHIIKCVEVEDGKDDWQKSRDALEADYSKFLFDAIVKEHRPKAKIYRDRKWLSKQ